MYISPTYTHTVQYIYIYIYIYIYLFIKSLLHVSAHTALSSGRTLVTSTATSSFYQYRWHRQALGNKFKAPSWKTNISKAIIFSGNNEAKREVWRECGCTWHACQTWDAYPRAHFQWKTLYKQGSKSKPLCSYRPSSVQKKCQRCKPGRSSSPQVKGMNAVTNSVHGFWDEDARATAPSPWSKRRSARHISGCAIGAYTIRTCKVSPLDHQCLVALHASGTE